LLCDRRLMLIGVGKVGIWKGFSYESNVSGKWVLLLGNSNPTTMKNINNQRLIIICV